MINLKKETSVIKGFGKFKNNLAKKYLSYDFFSVCLRKKTLVKNGFKGQCILSTDSFFYKHRFLLFKIFIKASLLTFPLSAFSETGFSSLDDKVQILILHIMLKNFGQAIDKKPSIYCDPNFRNFNPLIAMDAYVRTFYRLKKNISCFSNSPKDKFEKSIILKAIKVYMNRAFEMWRCGEYGSITFQEFRKIYRSNKTELGDLFNLFEKHKINQIQALPPGTHPGPYILSPSEMLPGGLDYLLKKPFGKGKGAFIILKQNFLNPRVWIVVGIICFIIGTGVFVWEYVIREDKNAKIK